MSKKSAKKGPDQVLDGRLKKFYAGMDSLIEMLYSLEDPQSYFLPKSGETCEAMGDKVVLLLSEVTRLLNAAACARVALAERTFVLSQEKLDMLAAEGKELGRDLRKRLEPQKHPPR